MVIWMIRLLKTTSSCQAITSDSPISSMAIFGRHASQPPGSAGDHVDVGEFGSHMDDAQQRRKPDSWVLLAFVVRL